MTTKLQILRSAVGFIYPVYRSVQAIMSEDIEDDLTWLRYWVLIAVVSLVELWVDPLVDYFPGYLLAKCAFLVCCMAPFANNGVSFIFTQVKNCMEDYSEYWPDAKVGPHTCTLWDGL